MGNDMGRNKGDGKVIGKINIDEAKKKRIIDKAGRLGDENTIKYAACSAATFASICEAFRSEGIEIFTPEIQEIITQGIRGLHAGIGETGIGTCGGITGSAFVISYVIGVTTEEAAKNASLNTALSIPIVEGVMDRFEETYGATDCLRLRYNRTQRAMDLLDPDAMIYEALFLHGQPNKCGALASCYECGRDQGMPAVGARWGAEAICDLLNMEPEERKRIPPHLQDSLSQDLETKVQKVAQFMKEIGLGCPNEKISWREYRTFKLKGRKGVEESRPCGVDAPEK
jgi:hypothetical protein